MFISLGILLFLVLLPVKEEIGNYACLLSRQLHPYLYRSKLSLTITRVCNACSCKSNSAADNLSTFVCSRTSIAQTPVASFSWLIQTRFGARQNSSSNSPVSILRKSILGRHRPVRVADGPMTARCRFT